MQISNIGKKRIGAVVILLIVGTVGTLTYYVRTHPVEVGTDVSRVKTNLMGKLLGTTTAKVSEDVSVVKTETIQVGAAAATNTYSGDVQGEYDTPLSFLVSGKVISRNVDVGSVVHKGDVLLALDTQDYEQNANIASAQLDTANSKLKLAEITLNRNRELLKGGAISQEAVDVSQNDCDSAQAAVKLASSQYQQSVDQLNYCTLHASCDGVVTAVNVEVGQVVATGTPAVIVSGTREVVISVPENQLGTLKQANSIKVSFWALPNVTIDGEIREVSPSADHLTRTYKVKVGLVNPPSSVQLGMTATVNIISSNNDKSIYIPLSAIYQTGDTPSVWILQDNTVTLRAIKVGNFGDDSVQVLEGLKEGDVIVTAGVHKLQKGQKVIKAGDQQ